MNPFSTSVWMSSTLIRLPTSTPSYPLSNHRLAADLSAMTRLHEISTRFVQESDVPSLLEQTLVAAIEFTSADMGYIQFLDPPSGASLAVVELGAGKAVATVRMTSEGVVRGAKATLIRINPRDYDVPADHIGIPFGACEGIRRVIESMPR